MLVLVMQVTSSFQISDEYILTPRPLPNIISVFIQADA